MPARKRPVTLNKNLFKICIEVARPVGADAADATFKLVSFVDKRIWRGFLCNQLN